MKKKIVSKTPKKASARVSLNALAAISRFASREETRFYLCGVRIEIGPKGTTLCATDGHRFMALNDSGEKSAVAAAVTIPTEDCVALRPRKGAGEVTATLTILTDKSVPFARFEMEDGTAREIKGIDGIYPDWRASGKIVPDKLSGKPAQFNIQYLASFDAFGNELGIGSPVVMHNGNDAAVLVYQVAPQYVGALMPMRKEATFVRPQWCAPQMPARKRAA